MSFPCRLLLLFLLVCAAPVSADTLLDQTGALRSGDPQLRDNSYYDRYTVSVSAGDRLRVTLTGTNYDPYLIVRDPNDRQYDNDDMAEGNQNSQLELTVAAAGTVTIFASSYEGSITGDYRLVVERLNGRPGASTPAAAGGGDWISGRLAAGDERHRDGSYLDYHSFTGQRGERITIRLESDDFDPYLFLVGPDNYQESNDDDGNSRNCRLVVTLPAAGTYQVIVNSYGEGTVTGAYRLRIERGTPAAAVTTAASAGTLAANRPASGRLQAGDQTHRDGSYLDQYTFNGRAGQTVTLRLESTEFDPIMFLNGPDNYNTQNDDANDNDRNAQLTVTLPATGEYRVYANSYGDGPKEGAYRLTFSEGAAAAAAGSAAADFALQLGAAATGTLAAGDVLLSTGEYRDCYSLELRQGQSIAADLTSSVFDPYVFIRGPNDFREDNDDYAGSRAHSRIEFSAHCAGTYRIYVTSARPGETGAYRLLANALDGERQTGTVAIGGGRTQVLPRDRAVSGTLGAGSSMLTSGEYRDVYTFSGRAGERIAITMTSSAVDPYLCLRGHGVEYDNDDARENSQDARLEYTLPATGDYEVFATTYRPGESGAYRLAFVTPGAGTTTGGSGTITLPDHSRDYLPPDNQQPPSLTDGGQSSDPTDGEVVDDVGGRVYGI
ncbi:MAG TPA: PPC domain-containing protein, partial [bacterium]|nr:PPC domain-containing protein [bacterium]